MSAPYVSRIGFTFTEEVEEALFTQAVVATWWRAEFDGQIFPSRERLIIGRSATTLAEARTALEEAITAAGLEVHE